MIHLFEQFCLCFKWFFLNLRKYVSILFCKFWIHNKHSEVFCNFLNAWHGLVWHSLFFVLRIKTTLSYVLLWLSLVWEMNSWRTQMSWYLKKCEHCVTPRRWWQIRTHSKRRSIPNGCIEFNDLRFLNLNVLIILIFLDML